MKRIRYFDQLRAFAILAVVILHVSGQNFRNIDIHSGDWFAMNIWESMSRWGVPVFAMISGALFLNREISLKMIYGRYVLRMGAAYIVWSTFYALMKSREKSSSLL